MYNNFGRLGYNDVQGKTVILDGFDEIGISNDRSIILNQLYWKLIRKSDVQQFSLIITCRENYIQNLDKLQFDYITLKPWNEKQIKSFCKIYGEITNHKISKKMIKHMVEKEDILGIPLILYMVLALNISIEKESSIVDVYEKIFSLEGGIYDRCIKNIGYEDLHRVSGIKNQIHQVSRKIAIRIFENNPDEACVSQEEYQLICLDVMQEKLNENESVNQDYLMKQYKSPSRAGETSRRKWR